MYSADRFGYNKQQHNQPNLFKKSNKLKKSPEDLYSEYQVWRKKNSTVVELFETVALEMIEAGIKRLSSDGIIHIVKYLIRDQIKTGQIQINNNYTPCFSRHFLHVYPEYKGIFELRKSKVDKQSADKKLKKEFAWTH
jgi:hypothetical protein